MQKLFRMTSAMAFRDIGRHRHCRSLQLLNQAKLLITRELLGQFITARHQLDPEFPNLQISK